jgi:hypothetical protein
MRFSIVCLNGGSRQSKRRGKTPYGSNMQQRWHALRLIDTNTTIIITMIIVPTTITRDMDLLTALIAIAAVRTTEPMSESECKVGDSESANTVNSLVLRYRAWLSISTDHLPVVASIRRRLFSWIVVTRGGRCSESPTIPNLMMDA